VPTVTEAHDRVAWNSFLASPALPDGRSGRQPFRPFLQSWEMGEVYRDVGNEIVRLEIRERNELIGICFGHIVPARRGRHLSIPYGPILGTGGWGLLLEELTHFAKDAGCTFIRMSPFLPLHHGSTELTMTQQGFRPSPLHLLAEHLWYLPLVEPDPWANTCHTEPVEVSTHAGNGLLRRAQDDTLPMTKEDIFKEMRATTRNLIRRAENEDVTITVSDDPIRDMPLFLALHDETRKRHGFTPYTDAFFHAQLKHFPSPSSQFPVPSSPSCSLYLAHYQNEVIAASIHMHFAGETSYHHGASSQKYRNIPASYLLQWHAIQDALARSDHIYNFWGIAPLSRDEQAIFLQEKQPKGSWGIPLSPCKKIACPARHPFAGVTTFKTGFGGKLLELQHCMDLPLSPTYYLTRSFETLRKWRRGF